MPQIFNRTALLLLRIGGFVQTSFMMNIILSGNFSFLNHLTIVPALACLDDACWPRLLQRLSTITTRQHPHQQRFRVIPLLLACLIGYLSLPVVSNLLGRSGRQVMNASFDKFRLVNTYGAFGSVGEARYEPVVSISSNGVDDWTELELPCKPGKLTRRPCFCAPYHYRLDWNIWFLGFKPHQAYLQRREQWLYHLLYKILAQNEHRRPWLDLLDTPSARYLENMYETNKGPKFARVDMYHYQMAAPLWKLLPQWIFAKQHEEVIWWKRTYEESLVPVIRLDPDTDKLTVVQG
eukprot:CAMPEP_0116854178 /NCGR_PEP_ID=MMETSP0418-20121206/18422_1 /TAXON_ID=1158023 /ORGANISM="Astrosyne radiata, Strain 13vi08-1A" /LENGTH=292 /DNA_ID=CAMNT_0004486859 /DNA_START=165 /DNA_END=1043 /DNA_ORIENTATION=-